MASIPADRMIVPPQSPEQTKSGTSKKRRPVGSGPLPPALPPICKIFKKKTQISQEILFFLKISMFYLNQNDQHSQYDCEGTQTL